MPHPRPLPDVLVDRTFRVAEASAAGVNRERLRRLDLAVPVHGVRAPRGVSGFGAVVAALALVMRVDQCFSHTSATRLWGAPLPRSVQADPVVHVSTVGGGQRMRRPGVVGHRLADDVEVVLLDGLRVVAPPAAWAQCASVLGARALVAVGDHMVGRSRLATIDDLVSAIVPGSRGVSGARIAVDRVRVGSESAMETWFRLAVVEAGFPEPELNVDVRDATGRFLGRVDMAWPELRIALEYDGDHHREREVFHHDQQRDNGFVVNDWLVIHATSVDAARPAVVFERLRQAFAQRVASNRRIGA
jgi:hypothetical protein